MPLPMMPMKISELRREYEVTAYSNRVNYKSGHSSRIAAELRRFADSARWPSTPRKMWLRLRPQLAA